MSLPPLPAEIELSAEQDERAIYGHTAEQMQAFYQQGYQQALLDAMNATLPFGQTGRVMAAAIGALK